LALNTPTGRYVALVLLFAWGAGRVTFDVASGVKRRLPAALGVAALSLAAVPLTVGFIGVWLLASELARSGRAAAALAVVGATILATCGSAMHFSRTGLTELRSNSRIGLNDNLHTLTALVGAILLLVGGILPGLWLPVVANIAGVREISINQAWWGLEIASLPTILIAAGALLLAGLAWLAVRRSTARAQGKAAKVLLPTAQEQLEKRASDQTPITGPSPAHAQIPAPTPALWLSLLWFEAVLRRLGALVLDWCAGAGRIIARLEGRYYLPLALILALVAILALAR
jgi:hypothetical protein